MNIMMMMMMKKKKKKKIIMIISIIIIIIIHITDSPSYRFFAGCNYNYNIHYPGSNDALGMKRFTRTVGLHRLN